MVKKALAVCGAILLIASMRAGAQEPSVLIKRAAVVQRSISESLTVYGRIEADPNTVQTISLLHDGLISRVAAAPGKRIEQGEILLDLTTSPGAHMDYLKARGAVDYARSEMARQQRLLKEKMATKAQVEAARNAFRDAQAGLQALEARKQDKKRGRVVAPAGGIITKVMVRQGDQLKAGAAALEMAVGNHMIARLGVEPEDVRSLAPGTPVTIRSVFVPDFEARSKVREIHAIINPATSLVDVLVPIPPEQTDHLVLGGRLIADIELSRRTGLIVPRSAVLQDEQGAYVFRVVDGKARRMTVSTGLESDQWIEVRSGLKLGDAIVSSGNYELKDGMSVREDG